MIIEVKGVMRCEAGMGRMVCSPYIGGQGAWVGVEGEQGALEGRGFDGYVRG